MKAFVGNKKRLLIVYTSNLFPVIMMSQNRTIKMIERLSSDYSIDLLIPNISTDVSNIEKYCERIYYYKHQNTFKQIEKLMFYIKLYFSVYILFTPNQIAVNRFNGFKTKLNELINNDYHGVILHYWYLVPLIRNAKRKKIIVDTHGLIYIKIRLQAELTKNTVLKYFQLLKALHYRREELKSLNKADHVIFNSQTDVEKYVNEVGKNNFILVSNGQDIDQFVEHRKQQNCKTLLFYGSLGGEQNQLAFEKLWLNILPLINSRVDNLKLLIVGANPPEWIKLLQSDRITVTGYVEDVKTYLAKSTVLLIPLITGSGFRGRVIEVMAMGIPVIGTHNALDCINIIHGDHGFISDSDSELARFTELVLNDEKLRDKLSKNCIDFVSQSYSIEATYGRLSQFLINI